MVTCQKWMVLLVSLQLLMVGTLAIPSPSSTNPKQSEMDDAPSVQLDSDTGDDRELKSDDDGYDFLSIDQLFLNNPQYRQLISDLQAHTFGSNWRRKRDVAEHELPDAFRSEEALSSPRASTVPTTTTVTATAAISSSTATETLVTDGATNRDITSTATTSDLPKAAALTGAPPTKQKESPKEVTKPSTASSTSVTSSSPSSSSSSSTTTTTTATSTSNRGSSTVATSAAYGSSGSTDLPLGRNTTVEMTTAAAPIRASTPRRLSHKNSSNKNKNKLSAAAAAAQANKPTTNANVGPSTVNVNKVSVSSNAVASSSSNQIPQQTPPAVTIPAPENGTATGPVGNNKDK
uniref:Uncharacterized protein n=1 Tax=Anopheles funestus TaxID=62324 RepID=A0A182RNS9_ANOFN